MNFNLDHDGLHRRAPREEDPPAPAELPEPHPDQGGHCRQRGGVAEGRCLH